MKELALCLDGVFPNKDINDFGVTDVEIGRSKHGHLTVNPDDFPKDTNDIFVHGQRLSELIKQYFSISKIPNSRNSP